MRTEFSDTMKDGTGREGNRAWWGLWQTVRHMPQLKARVTSQFQLIPALEKYAFSVVRSLSVSKKAKFVGVSCEIFSFLNASHYFWSPLASH